MPKKSLTTQLAETKQEIAILKREKEALENRHPAKMCIHDLLDAALDNLNKNTFYMRNVSSDGIASLVRSAREKLRVATKK